MTNRYGVGTGASLRDLHSLASRALNTFRGPGLVRYKSRSRRGACAWSEKPADIARLDCRNFIGFLRAKPLGEGVVKDMALEIADGQSECF